MASSEPQALREGEDRARRDDLDGEPERRNPAKDRLQVRELFSDRSDERYTQEAYGSHQISKGSRLGKRYYIRIFSGPALAIC